MSFFSNESLHHIRLAYATIDRIPFGLAKRLMYRVHISTDDAVRDLAGAQIKFLSRVARNELVRRGLAEAGHV